MGQTLSEPVTAKETASCADHRMKVGSSSMQGWRINMEDAHTHILSLPDDREASFFAVYDGHGGAKVSEYAGKHLHKRIVNSDAYASNDYASALRGGFLGLDEDMLEDDEMREEMAGTTAVCVLLKENKLFCANAGDSRAILSINGLVEPMSFDHKPSNEGEATRIINAGGWVEFGRVNGNLALSRALGDFIFKRNEQLPAEQQIVTADPDIIDRPMSDDIEFMVLACDGIWDVLSNQEVIDYVRDRLAVQMQPEAVCEELLTRCLAPDSSMGGLGCDNMTVVLVCILNDLTWQQYCEKCGRVRDRSPEPVDDEERDSNAFVTPPRTPNDTAEAMPTSRPKEGEEDDELPPQSFTVNDHQGHAAEEGGKE